MIFPSSITTTGRFSSLADGAASRSGRDVQPSPAAGADLLRSRQRASAQKQACAMTFEERLKFYQELNADKFAEWMMNQHLPAAKLLNREVLAVCWNRGVEASMGTEEQWRPVLALFSRRH
jgi:hypothetical protein